MTLKDINRGTKEGKLLFAALTMLTTTKEVNFMNGTNILGTKTTPDEMIDYVEQLSCEMEKHSYEKSVSDAMTPQAEQITKLADFILKNHPEEIREGGAVDNAIRMLSGLNPSEAIFGFVEYLTNQTKGVTLTSGHNPGNVTALVKKFIEANNLPAIRKDSGKYLTLPD